MSVFLLQGECLTGSGEGNGGTGGGVTGVMGEKADLRLWVCALSVDIHERCSLNFVARGQEEVVADMGGDDGEWQESSGSYYRRGEGCPFLLLSLLSTREQH